MLNSNTDICIRITLVNPQGQPLGGKVDLEFKPQTVGDVVKVSEADASKEIDVSGLQRTPQGLYQLTVTPTDVFKPVSQFVTIPASGALAVTITVDKGSQGGGGRNGWRRRNRGSPAGLWWWGFPPVEAPRPW